MTLRAERAEAAAVELRARLQSRTVEAHTSLIDVRHADDLTAACGNHAELVVKTSSAASWGCLAPRGCCASLPLSA